MRVQQPQENLRHERHADQRPISSGGLNPLDLTASSHITVEDVTPSGGLNPFDLTVDNGTLFFYGQTPADGYQFWASDGTSSGTRVLSTINPGVGITEIENASIVVNSNVLFTAGVGGTGTQLFTTDGTAAGTVQLTNFSDASLSDFINVNGTEFFIANPSASGGELWASDGTPAGTGLLMSFTNSSAPEPGANSLIDLTNVNGTLFFIANDGTNGTQLWASDGTSGGTIALTDVNQTVSTPNGPQNLGLVFPSGLVAVGQTCFFFATDGNDGTRLRRSHFPAASSSLTGCAPCPRSLRCKRRLHSQAAECDLDVCVRPETDQSVVLGDLRAMPAPQTEPPGRQPGEPRDR